MNALAQLPPEASVKRTVSRLISPTHVRAFLLATAAKTRHHKFERVSAATIDMIEAKVRECCAQIVKSAPSKGVTL